MTVRVGLSREVVPGRVAPAHVRAGLKQIDPNADLLYIGWGIWRLVTRLPDFKSAKGAQLIASAERLLTLWETTPRLRANPGAFKRLLARYEWAVMVYRGVRPIAEYRLRGEPTSAIVDDFRRMDWCFRHLSDDQVQAMLDAPADAKSAAANADLADPARGNAAWRYLFTRSHWVGDPGARQRSRSGFTTQRMI